MQDRVIYNSIIITLFLSSQRCQILKDKGFDNVIATYNKKISISHLWQNKIRAYTLYNFDWRTIKYFQFKIKMQIVWLKKMSFTSNVYLFLISTRLKKKIEKKSIWEGAFYQIEFKLSYFHFFRFMRAAASESELFCLAHLANNECFLYHLNLSF